MSVATGYALVVLPERRLATQVEGFLRDEGLAVVSTRDGREAARQLEERGAPELLVTELSLPSLDGFALLGRLRAQHPAERAPAVVVSAFAELRGAAQARRAELGLAAVLASGGPADALRRTLKRALARGRPEPESPPDPGGPARAAANEEARLRKVEALRLEQDLPTDDALQSLVQETATAFGVPVSLVTVVYRERQFFKAQVGLTGQLRQDRGTPRDWSFCRHAVAAGQPLVVPDAAVHPVFADNPLVRQGVVRSYAGAPLITARGDALGTLCIIDSAPRAIDAAQVDELVVLARRVAAELELRRPSTQPELEISGLVEQARAEQASPPGPFPALSYLSAVLAHLDDGVLLLDPTRRVVYANGRFAALTGLPQAQLLAGDREAAVRDLVARSADPEDAARRMRAPRSGPELFEAEVELTQPERRLLRWRTKPVPLPGGVGQLVLVADVTAERDLLAERERIARTDVLTGLANRRSAEEAVAREFSRARRHGTPLSFVLFDIDHFKRVNDTYGHAAGDRVLHALGEQLQRAFRGFDLASRWGGEEFLVLLPSADLPRARLVADRVRAQIGACEVPGVGRITVSAGVAELGASESAEEAIGRADECLYEAKRQGRDRVV